MDKILQAVFARLVSRGALTITTASGTTLTFGDGTGEEVCVRLADTRAELAIILDPHLYVGELFMDGRLIVERGTIYGFLELVLREASSHSKLVPAQSTA